MSSMKLSPKSSFTMPRTSGLGGTPQDELKQVLTSTGIAAEPYTLRTFFNFLESEHSEENARFYFEAEILRRGYDSTKWIPEDCLTGDIPSSSIRPAGGDPFALFLYKHYIQENSPEQVNISHELRHDLEKDLKQALGDDPAKLVAPPPKDEDIEKQVKRIDPEVFASAQQEVFDLMAKDSFHRFKARFSTMNLNQAETNWRYGMFTFMFLLNWAVVAIMLVFMVPRYYAFLSFFGWFGTFDYLLSARRKLCLVKAYYGLSLLEKATILENRITMWLRPSASGSCQISLQDPGTLDRLRRKAKLQFVQTICLAITFTLIAFSLTFIPPPM